MHVAPNLLASLGASAQAAWTSPAAVSVAKVAESTALAAGAAFLAKSVFDGVAAGASQHYMETTEIGARIRELGNSAKSAALARAKDTFSAVRAVATAW